MKVSSIKREITIHIELTESEALVLHTLLANITASGEVGRLLVSIGDGIEEEGVGFASLPPAIANDICNAVFPLAEMDVGPLLGLDRG